MIALPLEARKLPKKRCYIASSGPDSRENDKRFAAQFLFYVPRISLSDYFFVNVRRRNNCK